MAVVSAVPLLVSNVRAYFAEFNVVAAVDFGRQALTKQSNASADGASRVVFAPGDDGGSAGVFAGPRQNVGQNPRPVISWERLFTVSVWAVDTTDTDDELLQFVAVENLLEWTVAAIRSFAHVDGVLGNPKWTTSPVERVYGRELRFPLSLRGPLFAPAQTVVTTAPAVPTRSFP